MIKVIISIEELESEMFIGIGLKGDDMKFTEQMIVARLMGLVEDMSDQISRESAALSRAADES